MKRSDDKTGQILFALVVFVLFMCAEYMRYKECMSLFNSFWFCIGK